MMTPATRIGLMVVLAGGAAMVAGAWPDSHREGAVVLAPRTAVAQTGPASTTGTTPDPAFNAKGTDAPHAATAQETYATAVEIANCEQRSLTRNDASNDLSDVYEADPSGAMAADLQREAQARDERCRRIGPADYRRIDGLLQEAADQGSRDARSRQWQRRLDALLSRSHRGDRSDDEALPFGAQERAELGAIATGLEALALGGHGDSIIALQQLLSSDGLPVADPVRAAAWRLVSYQTAGQDMPAEDQMPGRIEVLDDLDDATRAQVLTLSRSLFGSCCRR